MELSRMALSISSSPTLAIDAKAKAMKAEGIDVIGFGAGEPDFDTPENIKEAAIKAIIDGKTKYTPASGIPALKKAVVKKFRDENGIDYEESNIVISNGAKHSLFNTFMAVCNPGDEVIIPSPFWVSYPEFAKLCGAVPVFLRTEEKNGFGFRIDDLEKLLTNKTKAILINSPSNPTGMIYSDGLLTDIAGMAQERDLILISDEIYESLTYDGIVHKSIVTLCPEVKDRTIIINGVSKTYAMTGWRIGYSASSKKIAGVMGNIQSHGTSNPNTIAQYAALEALNGPKDLVTVMKTNFIKRRDHMVKAINDIPHLSCLKPEGAFYVMVNISKVKGLTYPCGNVIDSSDKFAETLLRDSNVAVVPGSGFGSDDHIRLSYATSLDDIVKGIDRLRNFVSKLK
jgi:aspartate aminotransferase